MQTHPCVLICHVYLERHALQVTVLVAVVSKKLEICLIFLCRVIQSIRCSSASEEHQDSGPAWATKETFPSVKEDFPREQPIGPISSLTRAAPETQCFAARNLVFFIIFIVQLCANIFSSSSRSPWSCFHGYQTIHSIQNRTWRVAYLQALGVRKS